MTIIFSLIEFSLALYTLQFVNTSDEASLTYHTEWIPSLGISFHVGIDGISMLMILLVTALMPLIVYASFNKIYNNYHTLYSLMLMMQSSIIGSFVAMDGFLFYLFWEIALIPIFFILLMWGTEDRKKVTFRFFLYTLAGSLFMLLGLIWVYLHTENRSFEISELYRAGSALPLHQQGMVLAAFSWLLQLKCPSFHFTGGNPEHIIFLRLRGS